MQMTGFLGQLALPAVTTSRRVPIVGLRSIMIAAVTVNTRPNVITIPTLIVWHQNCIGLVRTESRRHSCFYSTARPSDLAFLVKDHIHQIDTVKCSIR